MKKCVVIYNPNSGKNNKIDFINKFEQILNENNYDVKFVCSKYQGNIVEIVSSLEDNIDLVISLGGDGTSMIYAW